MSGNRDVVIKPLEASSLEKAAKLANSSNKLLYIVVIEDPTVKTKGLRFYATPKVDKAAAFIELIGFEVTDTQVKQLKSWNDASELAEQGNLEVTHLCVPWQRVVSIKNANYRVKSV